MSEQKSIALCDIEPGKKKLRDAQTESDDFGGLMASIKNKGLLHPLCVREIGKDQYELVDGVQRYTALCMINKDQEVPCLVVTADDDEVLEMQMEGNLHRIETKPVQYSKQLGRLMMKHPTRNLDDWALRLSKSKGWIKDRLSLKKLEGRASELVDEGKIALTNAYGLAKLEKLAPEEVDDWVDRAQTMAPDQFGADILAHIEALKKSKRTGEKVVKTGPALKLRKLGDIKAEYHRAKAQSVTASATDHDRGYHSAMSWILQQDEATKEAWKRSEEERERAKEEAKAEREANKEAPKALGLEDLIGKV